MFMGSGWKVGGRLGPYLTPGVAIRDRSTGSRISNEQTVRVVRSARLLPREAAQSHATEDDRQRPNIRGAGVVFLLVIHLRRKVWIGAHDAYLIWSERFQIRLQSSF